MNRLLFPFAIWMAAAASLRAQSLETFVMTTAGESGGPGGAGCSTYQTPAPVFQYFGGHGGSVPLAGLVPCNVAGDLRSASATAGPLNDAMTLSTSWGTNTYQGATVVNASYGTLWAEGHSNGVFNSVNGSVLVVCAEGFSKFQDDLTFTSPSVPNGQAGTVVVLVRVTGGLSTGGNATSDVELVYQVAAGPKFIMFRSQVYGLVNPFMSSITPAGQAGFALSPGAMSGSGEFGTFAIPFVFGSPLPLRLGLMAYTVPSASGVLSDSAFEAVVSGFQVVGPGAQVLTNYAIASSSGTPYGPGGVASVARYCTPGTSASGCQALLTASGLPSASAPGGFIVATAGMEGAKDGLFFFGTNGRQANPWGNGTSFQCVVPPVKRAGLLLGTGTAGLCNGALSQDLNALWSSKPLKNPGAGALVQLQLWYRDPLNTTNQTTSLSDALEFTVQP